MNHVYARLVAVLFIIALIAAGCGEDEPGTATAADPTTAPTTPPVAEATSMSEEGPDHEMDDGDGGHDHVDVVEVPAAMAVPAIAVDVTPDVVSGANLYVTLTDFTIAPEHASGSVIDGEGHLHVYVDGERVARFYTEAFHLDIEPGEHQVRVEVSANNHNPYAVDGVPIDATATVVVAEPAAHHHLDPLEVVGTEPTVDMSVTEDPKSGWNVHVTTTNFEVSAAGINSAPVEGHGHLHLLIDGDKVARLYGSWFHLPTLTPGTHELTMELRSNDHRLYTVGGNPVTATTTVVVAGDDVSQPSPPGTAADEVVHVSFAGGAVDVHDDRVEVTRGETVAIEVTSDVDDELHVHGYDVSVEVSPTEPATVTFVADITGVFEVELESSHQFLFELAVR